MCLSQGYPFSPPLSAPYTGLVRMQRVVPGPELHPTPCIDELGRRNPSTGAAQKRSQEHWQQGQGLCSCLSPLPKLPSSEFSEAILQKKSTNPPMPLFGSYPLADTLVLLKRYNPYCICRCSRPPDVLNTDCLRTECPGRGSASACAVTSPAYGATSATRLSRSSSALIEKNPEWSPVRGAVCRTHLVAPLLFACPMFSAALALRSQKSSSGLPRAHLTSPKEPSVYFEMQPLGSPQTEQKGTSRPRTFPEHTEGF